MRCFPHFASALLCLFLARSLEANEPSLHEQIDRLIAEKAGEESFGRLADDPVFLRRVYLDFAGRIPSLAEAREFLADDSPQKRRDLIDRLLAGPEYPRRLSELFHVLLMERRGNHPEWEAFVRRAFETNRPWNRIAADILHPDADDEQLRGAAFFYTKRLEKYGQNPTDRPGLTRDVGRLFLGLDLQCAQCHDHLTIDDYEQLDFQGLLAVYTNVNIDTKAKFPAVVEKRTTAKLEFVSVFEGVKRETGPRVPFGRELEGPSEQSPDYSPLSLIANEICSSDNPYFSRNIVNRLWFVMMGRGLIEPLDEHHTANAPSHPELLDLLAREFVAHEFDIKWLLRELALTETYQRTSMLTDLRQAAAPELYLVAHERRLSAEQIFWSVLQATGELERLGATPEERRAHPDFQPLRDVFEKTFANPPKEPETEINATVKGALFVLNDGRFLKLLEKGPGRLTERLSRIEEPAELADELYLSVLTRPPSEEERADVARYLRGSGAQRDAAVRQFVWALLSSTEFFVNH